MSNTKCTSNQDPTQHRGGRYEMWVITVPKRPENINTLKQLTGILNFVIRIQDYKTSDRIKCAGEHNTRVCTKDAAHPARCANCGGQHSANYQGCTEAKNTRNGGAPREPPPSLSK